MVGDRGEAVIDARRWLEGCGAEVLFFEKWAFRSPIVKSVAAAAV
jgi:hypothetical protein